MFLWLWRRLGLANGDAATAIEYDAVYGLPKHAVTDWLKWNPQLKTGHADNEAERLRRDGTEKQQVDFLGDEERPAKNCETLHQADQTPGEPNTHVERSRRKRTSRIRGGLF